MGYYKEEICALLNQKQIPHKIIEHPPVFTMAEMEEQGIFKEGKVCKNLFLRNNKGNKHFLVSLPEEKQVDLKKLGELLENQKLSFASEERLQKYLGVTHGAVSPLGILNDATHTVTVVLDAEFLHWDAIGVHPNDNTATIWLQPKDLLAIIEDCEAPYIICKIP